MINIVIIFMLWFMKAPKWLAIVGTIMCVVNMIVDIIKIWLEKD